MLNFGEIGDSRRATRLKACKAVDLALVWLGEGVSAMGTLKLRQYLNINFLEIATYLKYRYFSQALRLAIS
jgi:hypothetical protein